MKRFLVVGLILSAFVLPATAAVVTIDIDSSVSDWGYYMGSGYNPPLFEIGDSLDVEVVYDDSSMSLISMQYTIVTGGSTIQQTQTDFTGYTTGVQSVDGGVFIYASRTAFLNNWALRYNQVNNPDLFSYNMQHVEGETELYAYNFNSAPVPEPATLMLLGLGGLLLRRRKA